MKERIHEDRHSPVCDYIISRGTLSCDCGGNPEMPVLTAEEELLTDKMIRDIGPILATVSQPQRCELDWLASLGPIKQGRKLSRKEKKAAKRGRKE